MIRGPEGMVDEIHASILVMIEEAILLSHQVNLVLEMIKRISLRGA